MNEKEIKQLVENGNPAPTWKEQTGSVFLSFQPIGTLDRTPSTTEATAQVDKSSEIKLLKGIFKVIDGLTAQVTAEVAAQVLIFCKKSRKASEIRELLKKRHWKTF